MLENPKVESTRGKLSENLSDVTMGNQQETIRTKMKMGSSETTRQSPKSNSGEDIVQRYKEMYLAINTSFDSSVILKFIFLLSQRSEFFRT